MHYQIFENRKSFPRAFVVSKVIYETDKKRILEMMFDLNLKNVALVEQEMILDQASGSATIETYAPAFIFLKATTTGRSLLVLTDNYYPGWKVKVNGQNQQIYRVDYSFRGVILPKGSSVIEFYYQPWSFDVGVYMGVTLTYVLSDSLFRVYLILCLWSDMKYFDLIFLVFFFFKQKTAYEI